jgi:ketosteroid isomerase-like protein
MSEAEKNIAVVQQIYQAFARGDVPGILEHIANDLRAFAVVSELEDVPWHRQITRKADVPSFFMALASECEFTRFEPRDLAAGGDHVYCTISYDVTMKRNGRKLSFDHGVHCFTFRNGRVVEWHGTEDTAKTHRALFDV